MPGVNPPPAPVAGPFPLKVSDCPPPTTVESVVHSTSNGRHLTTSADLVKL